MLQTVAPGSGSATTRRYPFTGPPEIRVGLDEEFTVKGGDRAAGRLLDNQDVVTKGLTQPVFF